MTDDVFEAPETIRKMLIAAWALLYSLTRDLHAQALYPMADPRGLDWLRLLGL